ncbi:MAG: sigma-70 family RNA polymerase sigma factor [Gemmatimonadota bacterium]
MRAERGDSPGTRPPRDGPDAAGEITGILARCANGDRAAFDRLVPLVYEDLRRIAHRRLRAERTDHTLDTTALVHEAYLELVDQATATWNDRAHFFAVAARVIRNVLVDYARRQGAEKRGGDRVRVPLGPEAARTEGGPGAVELIALDRALTRLGLHDPELERMVECRYFAGMTVPETAEALGTSERTVARNWTRARAYLFDALS